VVFGEPMQWPKNEARGDDESSSKRRYQEVSQEIMGRIAELQREAHARRPRVSEASAVPR
jgi:hypothetical protein